MEDSREAAGISPGGTRSVGSAAVSSNPRETPLSSGNHAEGISPGGTRSVGCKVPAADPTERVPPEEIVVATSQADPTERVPPEEPGTSGAVENRRAADLKIACLVMKYPTLSQTFIERDLLGLVAQGIEVEVHPIWDFCRPERIEQITPASLRVVRAPSLWQMGMSAVRELRAHPTALGPAVRLLRAHRPRHWEGWFMTLWGLFFALARAETFRRGGINVVHGAWATAPATAAAVLSARCGMPFSFGAHAYDLHRHGGDPLLAPKLQAARFVHTTTQANADDLARRFPDRRAEIVLSRRGLTELPAPVTWAGRGRTGPVRLLSVGRLVPKKGHAHQIDACWELTRRGAPFELKIIGDGPLRSSLEVQIAGAGLGKHVELAGALRPEQVAEAYRWADVFWHTGVVDSQGDRDGLPNVLPEAMAWGLPVISGSAGGAAEAVGDGGLVVEPTDAAALADAVERLARDPAERERMGRAGRAWVEENFLAERNTHRLAAAFRAAARGEVIPL